VPLTARLERHDAAAHPCGDCDSERELVSGSDLFRHGPALAFERPHPADWRARRNALRAHHPAPLPKRRQHFLTKRRARGGSRRRGLPIEPRGARVTHLLTQGWRELLDSKLAPRMGHLPRFKLRDKVGRNAPSAVSHALDEAIFREAREAPLVALHELGRGRLARLSWSLLECCSLRSGVVEATAAGGEVL
jgi:hypothetical protein